jgi:putative flippase GtrA
MIKRASKFVFIGGVCFGSNLLLLYLFVSGFHLHYMISAIFAGVITVVNYLLNYYWTFSDRGGGTKMASGGVKFFIVTGASVLLYFLLMYIFVSVGKINYMLSSIIATAISFVPKYILCYVWIWNKKNKCITNS